MRDLTYRLAALGIGASLLPFTLGVNACGNQEVCDGRDNDNDGQIDEDFDQDMDGYYSSESCPDGEDCDDQDPTIPGVEVQGDGKDNDCDGQIDEAQQPYTIRFVARYTGEPLKDVAVWLGQDGTGPSGYSDADGQITFELDDPVQDWSFGYHAAYMSSTSTPKREEHRIYSYQDDTLEPDQTIDLFTHYENYPSTTSAVTINGIVPETDGSVELYTNVTSYWNEANASSITFSAKQRTDKATWLFAAQFPPCLETSCSYIPERFAAVQSPVGDTTITLDRTFDQTLNVAVKGLDPAMNVITNIMELTMVSEGRLYFQTPALEVQDPDSRIIPFPALTGGLSGASLMVWMFAQGDTVSQEADFPWSSGSGSTTASMPPLLYLSDDYAPVGLETISGTTIDLLNDTGSDHEQLDYLLYQYQTNADGTRTYVRNSWSVSTGNPARPLTFATIPDGMFEFAPAVNPYLEVVFSGAAAAYGYADGTPEMQWAGAEFALAQPDTTAAKAGQAGPTVKRMTGAERRSLQLEAPVISR